MTALTAPVTPRPLRATAVYLVVMAALVLVWFAAAWEGHDRWRARGGFTDACAHFLAPTALMVVAYLIRWRLGVRTRPAAFEVRDGAFVAPAATHLTVASAAAALSTAPSAAALYLWPDRAVTPGLEIVIGRITLVTALATFLVTIALLGWRPGRVVLRPEGLRITYPHGSRDVPWDAVSPAPPPTGGLSDPELPVERPELLRSTGLADRHPRVVYLPAGRTWIRRDLLVGAINHYLTTPAARQTIGGFEGHEHLRRVLLAG